jgi:hypothetical protein
VPDASKWDTTEGYDVIGDVHGCAEKLEVLLDELGYSINESCGAYRHGVRRAVFVGDLIDRGPQQSATLRLVRSMVESGSAKVVMGNHEFNALCYATPRDGSGGYLRAHSRKNTDQHKAFLALTRSEQDYHREWFLSLPLWLDLGGLRVVHACWHEASLTEVATTLGGDRFPSATELVEATTEGTAFYNAVEVLLKGPEISLDIFGLEPFLDKDGHIRHDARVRWWDQSASTLSQAVVIPRTATTPTGLPYTAPDLRVDPSELFLYSDRVPVVYGHYWRDGQPHEKEDWTAHTACVDFSAVKGGTLVAYRWNGESEIRRENYHPHGQAIVPP